MLAPHVEFAFPNSVGMPLRGWNVKVVESNSVLNVVRNCPTTANLSQSAPVAKKNWSKCLRVKIPINGEAKRVGEVAR
jgi:hypothetical protein